MKKSLFAIAAAGAFAGAAQAQSSVTVYGILDAGWMQQTVKAAGVAGTAGATSSTAYGATTTTGGGFASSAESTSRLGFRGNEDLGGGLSAFFTVEFTLNPNAVNNVSGGTTGFNNRQSFVGLGKKGLGAVSVGTQYTPIHESVADTDPGQQNNMPGNVIYPIDLAVNSANSGLPASIGIASSTSANNNLATTVVGGYGFGSNNYTNRAGNSIKFVSERFSGVRAKLFYTSAGQTTNAVNPTPNSASSNLSGGINQFSGWGAGLDYTWQKLVVTGSYQSFKQQTYAGTIANANGQQATGWQPSSTSFGNGASTAALDTIDNQAYVGLTYDFGILKAYAQYINRKASNLNVPSIYTQRSAQQIGVRGFITPQIEGWASGGVGKLTTAYALSASGALSTQSATANVSGYQIGTNYWMSKRTNLYAIYGLNSTSNTAYPATAAGTATNPVSNNVSAYALGVRHTF